MQFGEIKSSPRACEQHNLYCGLAGECLGHTQECLSVERRVLVTQEQRRAHQSNGTASDTFKAKKKFGEMKLK